MDELALHLSSARLNIQELDNKRCAHCGEIPFIEFITTDANGQPLPFKKQYMDRASRIDCDGAGKTGSMPMTYHKKCWIQACRNYVSA